MTQRHPAMLSALAAALVTLGPAWLPAAERGCPALAFASDAGFRAHFPDLLERIRNDLSGRADIDACAHVELELDGDAIGVSVTLPDGRSTARSVARSDDVIPTLQALLLVPDRTPATVAVPAAPAPTRPRPTRRPSPVSPSAPTERDVASLPARAARQLGFELSVLSGARLGDGQFSFGAGALSLLEISRWLIGFEGRADGYRSIHGGDPETALELAILAGRRVDLGSVALDLTAGPGFAIKGLALSHTETVAVMNMPATPPAAPPPHSEPSSGPVPRLLLGARLGFSPRSVFRTFVGLDGELGPARADASLDPNISSPRLPTFTVGLALGATVGTP